MKNDSRPMENDAKELKSPCEFLSKKERLILGFLKDCPKQYVEIIEYLEGKKVKRRTANNLLKETEKERKIFRIKKDGRIFYRFNDFPDQINALLLLLDNSRIEDPWDKLFCEKLSYNFKTLYPRDEPKQIVQSTCLELKATYDECRYAKWIEALGKLDVEAVKGVIQSLRLPLTRLKRIGESHDQKQHKDEERALDELEKNKRSS